jgi:MFS family permease
MLQKFFLWMKKYERHLSALAMIAGFVADNIFFTRIDLLRTQLLLAAYTVACFIAIPVLHFIETRRARTGKDMRWRLILPLITQFALGGFWSAFVIFYGRSATFGASWPFLIFLFLVFLGSEYFHHYHARLVFTSVLFFFALYSYAIFAVPIYTHTMGTTTFLESGAVAIAVFALFTILLRILARERFREDVWRIRAGAFAVLVLMNLFYFTGILPPLPLSATAAGIYHNVERIPGAYLGDEETGQSWEVRYLGFPPTLHITAGDSLYAYSSVFAPTALTTSVAHRWQWYDPTAKQWVTKSIITYPIIGGRDGGYRGYSALPISDAGKWRVNIETSEGLLIAQLPFTVELLEASSTPPEEETITLN